MLISESVKTAENDLVVISGLHLLEGQSSETKKEKIQQLSAHLKDIPSHVPIHLELASMTSSDLMVDIASTIIPLVDRLVWFISGYI